MRVMVIIKANADTEAGIQPTADELGAMGNHNEELIQASIMLAGEGLSSSSEGAPFGSTLAARTSEKSSMARSRRRKS